MTNMDQLPHSKCYYKHFKCILTHSIFKRTPRGKYDYHSHLIVEKTEDKEVKYGDTQLEV